LVSFRIDWFDLLAVQGTFTPIIFFSFFQKALYVEYFILAIENIVNNFTKFSCLQKGIMENRPTMLAMQIFTGFFHLCPLLKDFTVINGDP